MHKRIMSIFMIIAMFTLVSCSEADYVITKEIKLVSDGNVKSYTTYEYEDDKIVKEISYNEDGEIEYYNVIDYDEQGREIGAVTFDPNGEQSGIMKWTYDESGYTVLIEKEGSVEDEIINVTLNENGDILKMENSSYGGIVEEYEYDENGYLVKVVSTTGNASTYTVYINDEKGKVLKAEHYGSEDNMFGYTRYYYNLRGKLVGEKEFYSSGNLISETEYEYKKK